MSQHLTSFDFEGSDLRFGTTDTDVPYVVASDFGKALGYRDARDATRLLDDAEKGTQIVRTPGGPQEMSVIYEDGIWELVFRSTLPGAKVLKSRVKEILREIRKTGSYAPAPMSQLDLMAAAVAQLQEQERRTFELESRTTAIEERVTQLDANSGWVTAMGWANVIGLTVTDNATMSRLGRRASAMLRAAGIEQRRQRDQRHGFVGLYPEGILEQAAEELNLI
jgi:prophage antirepressor-like protein